MEPQASLETTSTTHWRSKHYYYPWSVVMVWRIQQTTLQTISDLVHCADLEGCYLGLLFRLFIRTDLLASSWYQSGYYSPGVD